MTSRTGFKTLRIALMCALPLMAGCASLQNPHSAGDVSAKPTDPLSAWSDSPVKQTILQYLVDVTEPGSPDFVPPEDRLATFDFDGTIGCEKPDYMEVMVAVQRLCELTEDDPALLGKDLYKASCDGDLETVNAQVEDALLQAFAGTTQTYYTNYVRRFLDTARHPRFDRPYTQLHYLPMRQLIELLHAKGFAVYIVSGSQQGFTRSYGNHVLELEPSRLVGHAVHLDFSLTDDVASLVRQDAFVPPNPGGDGKAEIIRQRIGKQPIFAFGNSMGDLEMLQLATHGPHRGLGLILVHDDPEEYVYRDEKLEQHASRSGWQMVSMKNDFEALFPE